MKDFPGSLELLSIRLDELEKRICTLEHPEIANLATVPIELQRPNQTETAASSMQAGTFFPTLGRAMLGIAGAYVLRAVAEAGAMPRLAVSAVAVAYAFGWLIWAARDSVLSSQRRFIYASTSVLILAPLLWENTLHFHVFKPIVSAGILAAFAIFSTALDVRSVASRVSWITIGAAALTNITMGLATHDLLPFVFSLLFTLLAIDCGGAFGSIQAARHLVALVADLSIWGLIFIYAGPETARAEYPLIPMLPLVVPACILFLIEGASVAVTAVVRNKGISIFEAIQAVLAFLLAIWGVLVFAPSKGGVIAGAVCLGLSAAVYAASYLRLRHSVDQRNFRIFGVWAAGLLVAGTMLVVPREFAAIGLALVALAAYWIATRLGYQMLQLHGAAYFLAAAILAGLPQYVYGAMAGGVPARTNISVFVVLVCSALVEIASRDVDQSNWTQTVFRFVPLFLASCTVCAAVVQGTCFVWSQGIPVSAHHLALIRTLVISGASLCMAFAGSRGSQALMKHLAYAAVAFLAAKLLFEDLRHGHMEFVAASIFIFAITLIAVPRLIRAGKEMPRTSLSK